MSSWSQKEESGDIPDNRTEKRKTGDVGENAVCELLKSQSFSIVEQNYLRKWGELDIVAKKNGKLHFIEVKSISYEITDGLSPVTENSISRESSDQFRAEDNLHPHKLERLKRAIQTYVLDRHVSEDTEWQFDVATVKIDHVRKICKVSIMEDIIL